MPYIKTISEKIAKVMKNYNIKTIHKPTKKLKGYVCNMKTKVHPMDRVGAVYKVECKRHKEIYAGETERALKVRSYEHKIINHKESEKNHTNENKGEKDDKNIQGIRKSGRNIKRINYREMNSGENIITNEGNTEVSKHIANQEHEKGDVTIKAMAYDENWYIDEGTYHLSPIYDNIIV